MNETERVLAMLEAGNNGMPSRAAKVIRELATENTLMKYTIARVQRHLVFASQSKINPDPKMLMAYFEEMAKEMNTRTKEAA